MAKFNEARIDIGDADKLAVTLNSIFKELGVQVNDSFQAAFDSVGKEAVQKLRSTSPKAKGSKRHYATGWTYKKANIKSGHYSDERRADQLKAQIYNKTKPGLAHLLEHGHLVVGPDWSEHGHTTPQPHIAEVNDWVQTEIVRRITQNLQK